MSKVTDLFKKKREKEAAQQEQKAAEEVKNINFTSLLYEQLKTLSPEARQHVDFYVQQNDYGKAIINWNLLLQITQINQKLDLSLIHI